MIPVPSWFIPSPNKTQKVLRVLTYCICPEVSYIFIYDIYGVLSWGKINIPQHTSTLKTIPSNNPTLPNRSGNLAWKIPSKVVNPIRSWKTWAKHMNGITKRCSMCFIMFPSLWVGFDFDLTTWSLNNVWSPAQKFEEIRLGAKELSTATLKKNQLWFQPTRNLSVASVIVFFTRYLWKVVPP